MKKADRMKNRLLAGVAALVLGLGIFGWGFTQSVLVGHAESQAKVTAPKGANIRKEASTSSAAVGGAENGKVLTVISQVEGGDGKTWYQVKSGDITGYIRSDLVEVSEGNIPAEGGEGGGNEGGAPAPADIVAVNPINATVSGEAGKIRDSASSEGQIIAEASAETMLTVTGQATDADGRIWYQVNFMSGDTQVEGFIRYDFVTLAGEVTPLTDTPATPEEPEPTPVPEPEKKLYDTILQDNAWLLVDYTGEEAKAYSIDTLFKGVVNNGEMVVEGEKTIKNQKIIIIVLVFLLVAAAAGIAFLVFKLREMMDSAYFNEVEKETIRKKNLSGDRQRATRTGGQERAPGRPAGARPSGYNQDQRASGQGDRMGTQGQRPMGSGQRPSGGSQGQRVSGQGDRMGTQGQRPMGSGQRPSGGSQGQRPMRPVQEPRPVGDEGPRPMGTGPRPSGVQQGARRPAGASPGSRPVGPSQRGAAPGSRPAQANAARAQSRNFMAEEDDLDNKFLKYDE